MNDSQNNLLREDLQQVKEDAIINLADEINREEQIDFELTNNHKTKKLVSK